MKRACVGAILVALIILSPNVFASQSPTMYPFNIQWDGASLLWQPVDGLVKWILEYEIPEIGQSGEIAQLDGSVTTTELNLKSEGGKYIYVKIWGYDLQNNPIAYDKCGFYLSRHVDLTNSTLERMRWMLTEVISSIQIIVQTTAQQFENFYQNVVNNYQQWIYYTFVPSASPAWQNMQDSAQNLIDKTPIGEITREASEIKYEFDDLWSNWQNGLPSDAAAFQELFTFDYGEIYGMNLKIVFPVAMYVQNETMQYFWDIAEAIILITFVLWIIKRLGVQINV